MANEFSLTFEDEGGPRRVAVDKARFRVGRGEENDLRIGVAGLSRSHALLEVVAGRLYLSDCGSSNGTSVNGRMVQDAVEVYDGDRITLGNACTLVVSAGAARVDGDEADTVAPPSPEVGGVDATPVAAQPEAAASKAPLLGAHVLVGGVVGVVLLAAVVLLALYLGGGSHAASADDSAQADAPEESDLSRAGRADTNTSEAGTGKAAAPARTAQSSSPTEQSAGAADARATTTTNAQPSSDSAGETALRGNAVSASDASTTPDKEAVRRVMSRISNDDSPYISDEGVRDVAAKVREYRGSSSLAGRIRAMSRGCDEVTALARTNNLKPSLLAYAALAESESGGDPVAAARRMVPKLLLLRATFGTDTANSSLLLVAAYPYPFDPPTGEHTRTPHPLASKLVELGGRNSVVSTSVARTVWFLREKNAVTPEAYDLVVRMLAVGVIAQRPQQYGLDAPPVWC